MTQVLLKCRSQKIQPMREPKTIQDHKPSTGDFKGEGASLTPPTSDEEPIAPDQFDATYETSKWEIWAYYSYYIGNNGLTLFNFAPTAFQNLLSQAADNSGVIHFAGADRTINSVVLLCNGISFAIQIFVFLVIGSLSKASFT